MRTRDLVKATNPSVATPAVTLLAGASATGTAKDWPGGRGVLSAWGTFGSGSPSACLEFSPDNGATWLSGGPAVSGANLVEFELPRGKIRAALYGVTGASISASVQQI